MFRRILYNKKGELRRIFVLLSFILLFQVIGVLLIKLFIPIFKGNEFLLSFMVNVISCIAVLLALYLHSKYLDCSSLAEYGLRLGEWSNGSKFINGAIIGLLGVGVVVLIQFSTSVINFSPGSIYKTYDLWIVYLAQSLRYLSGAVFEEILATSFLFVFIRYSIGTNTQWYNYRNLLAITVSALVFGFIHGTNENVTVLGVINLILFGALTTFNFAITKNLGFAVGFHLMWNFTQNVIFGLPNSGSPSESWIFKTTLHSTPIISGGKFGIEGSLITSIILGLIFCYEIINLKTLRFKQIDF